MNTKVSAVCTLRTLATTGAEHSLALSHPLHSQPCQVHLKQKIKLLGRFDAHI